MALLPRRAPGHGYGPPTALLRGGHCLGARAWRAPSSLGWHNDPGVPLAVDPEPSAFPRSSLSVAWEGEQALALEDGKIEPWRRASGSQSRPWDEGLSQAVASDRVRGPSFARGHPRSDDVTVTGSVDTPEPAPAASPAVCAPAPSRQQHVLPRRPRVPAPLLPPTALHECLSLSSVPGTNPPFLRSCPVPSSALETCPSLTQCGFGVQMILGSALLPLRPKVPGGSSSWTVRLTAWTSKGQDVWCHLLGPGS